MSLAASDPAVAASGSAMAAPCPPDKG
jgi:hypothetical protein